MPAPRPVSIEINDLEEKFAHLNPSQRAFIFSPERFQCIDGGVSSGKSFACCLKALVISAMMPGNVGMIMRYHATDLEQSTMKTFFDVCPPSWIKTFNKNKKVVILRNNSVIIFRHIHDAGSSARSRVLGADLGWFFIDQLEQCEEAHWDVMLTRIRRVGIAKKFGFAAANPNGHDWIWRKFFQGFQPWPKDDEGNVTCMPDGKFYQICRPRENYMGIAVNSEENRIVNGGFVDDDFFQNLKDTLPPETLARWVYCSFDEFRGKLYRDYEAGLESDNFASVHNIEPFAIPKNWLLVTGIDIGGDSPWAVIPTYIDEQGNLIVAPGFHERTAHVPVVANWIKSNTPYNESRTIHVIDPENKPAAAHLGEFGIWCRVADKAVVPGILRTAAYFYVNKKRQLPSWYQATQPMERFQKFRSLGSPKVFVFKTAYQFRKEHDTAKWDPNKPDKMYKTSTERWDSVEAFRYVCMTRPEPSKFAETEVDFDAMHKRDPLTAKAWREYDRRIQERQGRMNGSLALREADMDVERDEVRGQFEFSAKDEM